MVQYTIVESSFSFSLQIISFYRHLTESKREYIISKQLLRSWTSIGANIREAQQGESKKDFLHKMNIALKEANETIYRLDLLSQDQQYITNYEQFTSLHSKSNELMKVLIKIVKTTKKNLWKL